MSMGLGTDRGHQKVVDTMQSVVKMCERSGKIPGTLAATPEEAKKWQKLGFRFIALGSDSKYLYQGAKQFLEQSQIIRKVNQTEESQVLGDIGGTFCSRSGKRHHSAFLSGG